MVTPEVYDPHVGLERECSMRSSGWTCVGIAMLALTACSAPEIDDVDEMVDVTDEDRLSVQVASSRQLQIGYQILAVASQDDALDFCHEMCNRGAESCSLSSRLCHFSVQYPHIVALTAKCSVGRERCRQHGAKIPRQCACEGPAVR